jgi:hypothetical protein
MYWMNERKTLKKKLLIFEVNQIVEACFTLYNFINVGNFSFDTKAESAIWVGRLGICIGSLCQGVGAMRLRFRLQIQAYNYMYETW